MSTTRAKLAAAAASFGVLGLGWGAATANGATAAVTTAATSTATTTGTTTATTTGTTTNGTTGTTTSTTGWTDGTYTGSPTTFRFGTVTVTVTVSGGRITSVTEKLVSDGQQKSNQINARAVPTLKSAILAANSASVSTVSGATYTTTAYLTSLQSALDQA